MRLLEFCNLFSDSNDGFCCTRRLRHFEIVIWIEWYCFRQTNPYISYLSKQLNTKWNIQEDGLSRLTSVLKGVSHLVTDFVLKGFSSSGDPLLQPIELNEVRGSVHGGPGFQCFEQWGEAGGMRHPLEGRVTKVPPPFVVCVRGCVRKPHFERQRDGRPALPREQVNQTQNPPLATSPFFLIPLSTDEGQPAFR